MEKEAKAGQQEQYGDIVTKDEDKALVPYQFTAEDVDTDIEAYIDTAPDFSPYKNNIFISIVLGIWQVLQVLYYSVFIIVGLAALLIVLARLAVSLVIGLVGISLYLFMSFPIWYGIYYLITEKLL